MCFGYTFHNIAVFIVCLDYKYPWLTLYFIIPTCVSLWRLNSAENWKGNLQARCDISSGAFFLYVTMVTNTIQFKLLYERRNCGKKYLCNWKWHILRRRNKNTENSPKVEETIFRYSRLKIRFPCSKLLWLRGSQINVDVLLFFLS